ncbi:YARHG domain-containing protein [Sporosarcina ureae]|uniref:YARHG domain-containing protein n=1 Tax=Sporosarcina ureae TaxID=1571 RepID=UPI0034E96BBE
MRLARNGYVFKSADLQAYFDSQTWYVANESSDGEITDVEQHNVTLIRSVE